jgi:hypothetical protein
VTSDAQGVLQDTQELRVDPFVTYLRAKLEDAGLLAPA